MEAVDIGKENERPEIELGAGPFKVPDPVKPKESLHKCEVKEQINNPEMLARATSLYARTKIVQGSPNSKFNALSDIKIPPSVTVRRRFWEQTPHKKIAGVSMKRSGVSNQSSAKTEQVRASSVSASSETQQGDAESSAVNAGENAPVSLAVQAQMRNTSDAGTLEANNHAMETAETSIEPYVMSEKVSDSAVDANASVPIDTSDDTRIGFAMTDTKGNETFSEMVPSEALSGGGNSVKHNEAIRSAQSPQADATPVMHNNSSIEASETKACAEGNAEFHTKRSSGSVSTVEQAAESGTNTASHAVNDDTSTNLAKVASESRILAQSLANTTSQRSDEIVHDATGGHSAEEGVLTDVLVTGISVASVDIPLATETDHDDTAHDRVVHKKGATGPTIEAKQEGDVTASSHSIRAQVSTLTETDRIVSVTEEEEAIESEGRKKIVGCSQDDRVEDDSDSQAKTETTTQVVLATETVKYQEHLTTSFVDTASATTNLRTSTDVLSGLQACVPADTTEGDAHMQIDSESANSPISEVTLRSLSKASVQSSDVAEPHPSFSETQGVDTHEGRSVEKCSTQDEPDMKATTSGVVENIPIESTTSVGQSADADIVMVGTDIAATEVTERVQNATLEVDTIMTDVDELQNISQGKTEIVSPSVGETVKSAVSPCVTAMETESPPTSSQSESGCVSQLAVGSSVSVNSKYVSRCVSHGIAETEVPAISPPELDFTSQFVTGTTVLAINRVDTVAGPIAECEEAPSGDNRADVTTSAPKTDISAQCTVSADLDGTNNDTSIEMDVQTDNIGGNEVDAMSAVESVEIGHKHVANGSVEENASSPIAHINHSSDPADESEEPSDESSVLDQGKPDVAISAINADSGDTHIREIGTKTSPDIAVDMSESITAETAESLSGLNHTVQLIADKKESVRTGSPKNVFGQELSAGVKVMVAEESNVTVETVNQGDTAPPANSENVKATTESYTDPEEGTYPAKELESTSADHELAGLRSHATDSKTDILVEAATVNSDRHDSSVGKATGNKGEQTHTEQQVLREGEAAKLEDVVVEDTCTAPSNSRKGIDNDDNTDQPSIETHETASPLSSEPERSETADLLSVSSVGTDGDVIAITEVTTTSPETGATASQSIVAEVSVLMRDENKANPTQDTEQPVLLELLPNNDGMDGTRARNTTESVGTLCEADLMLLPGDVAAGGSCSGDEVSSQKPCAAEEAKIASDIDLNGEASTSQTIPNKSQEATSSVQLADGTPASETESMGLLTESKTLCSEQNTSIVDKAPDSRTCSGSIQTLNTSVCAQDKPTLRATPPAIVAQVLPTLSLSSKRGVPQDFVIGMNVKLARHDTEIGTEPCKDSDSRSGIPMEASLIDVPSALTRMESTSTSNTTAGAESPDAAPSTAKRKLEQPSDDLVLPENDLVEDSVTKADHIELLSSERIDTPQSSRESKRACFDKEASTPSPTNVIGENKTMWLTAEIQIFKEHNARLQEKLETANSTAKTMEETHARTLGNTLKELSQLSEHNAKLKVEAADLKSTAAVAEEKRAGLVEDRCRLERECVSVKTEAELLRVANMKLSAEMTAQAEANGKVGTENEKLKAEYEVMSTELEALKFKYSQSLENDAGNLKQIEIFKDESGRLRSECEALKSDLDALQTVKISLQKNIEEVQLKHATLQTELAASVEKSSALERTRDALVIEVDAMRSATQKVPELEKKVETLRLENKQVTVLHDTVAALKAEVTEKEKDKECLKQAKDALASEMNVMREDLKELPGLKEGTSKLNTEIEQMRATNQQMTAEAERHLEDVENIKKERDAFEREIETMRQNLVEFQTLNEEVCTLKQENETIAALQKAGDASKEVVDSLQKESERLTNERDVLASDKNTLVEEMKALRDRVAEHGDAKQEALKLQEEATKLTTELSKVSAANMELNDRLRKMGDCVQDNLRLAVEIKALKSRQEDMDRIQEMNSALTKEAAELREGATRMKKLSEDNTLMADEVLRLRGRVSELEVLSAESKQALEDSLKSKSQDERQTKSTLARVESELVNAQRDLSTLEDSFGQLNERYRKMKEINANLYKNENLLKQATQENLNIINAKEERYNLLKKHAQAKIAEGNTQIDQLEGLHAREKATWAAKQKITEMNLATLEKKIATQEEEYDSLKKLYIMTQNLVVQLQQSQ
ncbi:hypothetical protein SARC_02091 [Sphaeroforma arctica JP610]|uniref:Transforming acidic coiled-coil-containing protein C-terminal domain-containing protein n=1 Tax=Sphaeroforma arctica JP610 TaxID=667725 RepID=A0A0L0G9P4_9EUKA|nr:hypothetical protein SARC_02091 [Sphaeroforma arctica JP610]KNC85752.1 hypothetical protein SARC_02091 [Sphaeroforma arctica JP610]|eukprot:XP_014159654.1 hypothetical protein SARC_02091 [Sphaeroforma arctica JP610]